MDPLLELGGSSNPKCWTVLENNPQALNQLSHELGLPTNLSFHDVYSLTEPSLLSLIPRPVHALCVIIPLTPAWHASRVEEDTPLDTYQGKGEQEPVLWFKQTIGHACGSIAMIHCCLNGAVRSQLTPGSELERIATVAEPLKMMDRAHVLWSSKALEDAHRDAAALGDTVAPDNKSADKLGQHFVAFVKGKDGHLWELEGSRKGPIDRGLLADDEDLLSPNALKLGLGRVIEMESKDGGDLRFSCTALAPSLG
ncbi:ubiquitin carboxyl-terminal hydrolase-3 [Coleophoma cylindrospora]|uniref:Ubiquitin carboxyl-terminal hydrolase n=1 Tax=Coleophoma cylindrospora TaxID=1849047 RepID=A0A3D8R709_9HELO|nr:ubiquitin carboxyl-terminal hydrolase-3 [Coleophoma cylindrospora]